MTWQTAKLHNLNSEIGRQKKYDANEIALYYSSRPWQVVKRAIFIVWSFGWFFIHIQWDRFNNRRDSKKRRSIELRQILTNLGPTFIKVGQALSTRPDLIHPEFLDELVKLQDQLPSFDNKIAFSIIENSLKIKIDKAYREISPNPVAAASLGQVYRAILYTGEEVAVKVQRANLESVLTCDLFLMRWVASKLSRFLPLNLEHDLTLIVDEFGSKLLEEIDYINEGKNAEKFAYNFQNDADVKVPKIYWDFSSDRILTLEWIQGYKLTNTEQIKNAGLDPYSIIKIGVISGLKQLLEHGFFHADPHPGNLFATHDGRMAFIDFGMMDQLDNITKEIIANSVVQLINQDYDALAQDFVKLGFLTPDTDIKPIIPALEKILGNAITKNVNDFNFKTITDDFSKLVHKYPFRLPAKFALIIRSLITQEGLALSLDPSFKLVEIAYPYIAKQLLTGETSQLRRRLSEILIKDNKFQWSRLENMLTIASSEESFNLLPTAQLSLQYLFSDEGQYLRHKLLLALTENDKLHIEEIQKIWKVISNELHPQQLLTILINILQKTITVKI